MTDYTDEEKYLCAVRELKMRRKVYPRWVQIHRMTQEQADREIELMEAIMKDYYDRAPRLI
jgi:hypothetical protein